MSVDEGPESPHTPITGRGRRRRAGELVFFAMFGSLCFSYTGKLVMFFYKVSSVLSGTWRNDFYPTWSLY